MNNPGELLSAVYSTTVSEVSLLVREVRVRIGILPKRVTIRIYYDGKSSEPYRFELSAEMKTEEPDPNRNAGRNASTEVEALRLAVRCLTQGYEDAVRRGEIPDDSWLVGCSE